MPKLVETTDPDGVDFGWVMQTTFVLTIVVGAPIVALLSIPVSLPTWNARVSFAVRVGAILWVLIAIGAFVYARRTAASEITDRSTTGNNRPRTESESKPRDPGGGRTNPRPPTADGGEQPREP